jgi:hypothetical protein
MLRHDHYKDLFKYNRELFDDDYNHGQAFVKKLKHKSTDGELETNVTTKVAHPNESGHSKLVAEVKFKRDKDGEKNEAVLKNNGFVSLDS